MNAEGQVDHILKQNSVGSSATMAQFLPKITQQADEGIMQNHQQRGPFLKQGHIQASSGYITARDWSKMDEKYDKFKKSSSGHALYTDSYGRNFLMAAPSSSIT